MLFTDVIRTKRDDGELSAEQIRFFVNGLSDESIPAEQVSALAMAIFLNSMNFAETATLTMSMASSGTVLDWSDLDLDGPVVDKHSTGGVGDKVSLMLAPIVAACGGYVPMITGRGLGHTGGTTDKCEAIPGYNTAPDFATFRKTVREIGCAIIGQTADLAPADRRFYTIRDVTGTVESVPLITASIMAKKIAAGLEALVMDVKVGSGAFMPSLERARELGSSIVRTAGLASLKTHVLITDMNEVLGRTAGNALEIAETIRYLKNEDREPRLDALVMGLCVEMLVASGIEADRDIALRRTDEAVSSGRALEVFAKMITTLGGPADFVDKCDAYLAVAPVIRPIRAQDYLASIDTRSIGNAIIGLGGGRRKVGEKLNMAVGFSAVAAIGTELGADTPLAIVHAASETEADIAEAAYRKACTTASRAPEKMPVIREILTGAD
ncbi:MAG: thymidine phosphorylase [Proteobacteria bacterium]|nr:thymidine phosphorylase [Pseudomonadota bacterium]MDA1063139.1 thymidine phosphorylase [Pseudomonadota bacterium]